MKVLRIICATRGNADAFTRTTRLGISLRKVLFDSRIVATVACGNAEGLPAIYNRAIVQADDDEVLLFVHDDVAIDDFNLFHRIDEALRSFDVIGLAGTVRADARHVGWSIWRNEGERELRAHPQEDLSGAVGQCTEQGEVVYYFGPAPRQCILLDGCFLAARACDLKQRQVQFDERFTFHFYDLDFSRTCTSRGLRLGTWPIAVTHQSLGAFGTPQWEAGLELYRKKWAGDVATLKMAPRDLNKNPLTAP